MIAISETYDIVTEESSMDGDSADCGFVTEYEELTFRELVRKLADYPEASCSGPVGLYTWFSSYGEQDYRTGDCETRSIHFHRDNAPRLEKYWRKAAAIAHKPRR